MEPKKVLIYLGYAILGVYVLGNVLFIIKAKEIVASAQVNQQPEYSIFISENFFLAYNIWGILLCLTTGWAIYKRNKSMFMFSLFLLLVVMFYPWFTSQPGKKNENTVPKDTTITMVERK